MKIKNLLVLTFCSALALQAQDIVGTWKLNIEKSKLVRPIQAQTWTMEKVDGGHRLISKSLRADKKGETASTVLCDGKEHPDSAGVQMTCEVSKDGSFKMISRGEPNSFEQLATLSGDKKQLTVQRKSTRGAVKNEETLIYDRE